MRDTNLHADLMYEVLLFISSLRNRHPIIAAYHMIFDKCYP